MYKGAQTSGKETDRRFGARDLDAIRLHAAGLVHDFKNVLTVIECSLSLLARCELNTANRECLVLETSKSLDRGKKLAQWLLDMSRGMDLVGERICLAELISSLKSSFAATAGPLVEVELDMPAGLPSIYADRIQLELALLNLVINARDAMPAGGKICISINLVRPCSSSSQASYLRIVISDTGQGMDEETLARATDLFFTTKAAGRGTGLGLWQVRRYLSDLGGDFALSSTPGEGTTAELWFPVADNLLVFTPESLAISQI